MLCMFYQNFLKKGKGCSERTGEQTTAAQLCRLAIRLMSSWRGGAGSVTSRWRGEQSAGLVSTTEPSRRPGSLLLERGVGFTAGRGRAGPEELHLHSHLSLPAAGCLLPHTSAEIWRFTFWKMWIRGQSAVQVIWANKRKDQKVPSWGYTNNSPPARRGLEADVCRPAPCTCWEPAVDPGSPHLHHAQTTGQETSEEGTPVVWKRSKGKIKWEKQAPWRK